MGVQKLSELCYISKHFYVMGCDHAGSFLLYLLAIYKGHLPCRDLFPILNGGGGNFLVKFLLTLLRYTLRILQVPDLTV